MDYISVRQILDDLLADDMMKGCSLERVVKYAVEFIKVIGMPPVFDSKVAKVDIKDYRGELPCDFYKVIQVKDPKGFAYISSEGSFSNQNKPDATPAFTYLIKGNVIFTSTKDTSVEVAYYALNVDEEGFPLIPDNGTFSRALELYIQKRYFTTLFNSGKISIQVLHNVQQEYAFYAGQAQSDLIKPDFDQMESIKNMWTELIPRIYKHADGFKTVNTPEILRF